MSMKIFVISLVRALDRRANVQYQFEKLHLDFEFVDATDGRSLSDHDRSLVDHDKRKWISKHPLSDNEIGCWLSHLRAMQNIIDRNLSMALIMEDDATLAANVATVLDAVESNAGPFDVIALHHNKKEKGMFFVPTRSLSPELALGRFGFMNMGGYAYIVSQKGARKFIQYSRKFVHSFDKELHRYWANGLDIYSLNQAVAFGAELEQAYSYIEETRKGFINYDEADTIEWRTKRTASRVLDSIKKRIAFRKYVKSG